MSSGHHPKLFYFNSRGRAEIIRLIFAAKGKKPGVDYDDVRYTKEEWEHHKNDAPFKQLPYMFCPSGNKFAESLVIARLLATKFGLAGSDHHQQGVADTIATSCRNLLELVVRVRSEEDESRKTSMKEYVHGTALPNLLDGLSHYAGNHKFFLGDHLSWADLVFYDTFAFVLNCKADIFANHDNLHHIYENVQKDPNIKAWLDSRPKTEF